MADIDLGQISEALNDKADRDIENLSISGFDATKTQVIKNDNGVIKWAAESGGGGGGSYTAGEGIKIQNDTISFDGTTIPGYDAEDGPGYLKYYHGDGYTFIGFGEAPIPVTGTGLIGDGGVIKLDLRPYGAHMMVETLTDDLNKEMLCFSSFPGYFSPDITLGASGTYFDGETCGWFAVWVAQNPNNKDLWISAQLNAAGDGHLVHLRSDGKFPSLLIPKQKEQLLSITHNFDSTIVYTCKNIQPEHYKA